MAHKLPNAESIRLNEYKSDPNVFNEIATNFIYHSIANEIGESRKKNRFQVWKEVATICPDSCYHWKINLGAGYISIVEIAIETLNNYVNSENHAKESKLSSSPWSYRTNYLTEDCAIGAESINMVRKCLQTNERYYFYYSNDLGIRAFIDVFGFQILFWFLCSKNWSLRSHSLPSTCDYCYLEMPATSMPDLSKLKVFNRKFRGRRLYLPRSLAQDLLSLL